MKYKKNNIQIFTNFRPWLAEWPNPGSYSNGNHDFHSQNPIIWLFIYLTEPLYVQRSIEKVYFFLFWITFGTLKFQ